MDAYDARDLGLAIRRLRKRRGWTQVELAEWLGVNPVTVGRLEHGNPVALTIAMRAISLLGAKVVIVPRTTRVSLEPEEPRGG
jgi:DNA-binding XRE family transcriptional regulator